VARRTKRIDYAVYPPDFHLHGFCWTYRVATKARSKAKSLGVGSWIRRYVNPTAKGSELHFEIDRMLRWNGIKFVRIRYRATNVSASSVNFRLVVTGQAALVPYRYAVAAKSVFPEVGNIEQREQDGPDDN
jgi:hypothetical protein